MQNNKLHVFFLAVILIMAVSQVAAAGGDKSPKSSDLVKIEFIHWKKGFAKPDTAKPAQSIICYKFLTPSTIKWLTTVNYSINISNSQGLSSDFIASAVKTAAETWDSAIGKELMNNNAPSFDPTTTYGVQDYKNSITFGNYPSNGVIAVTSVWYNTRTKTIVEFDMMFDNDWTWGDASINPSVMDLQNIATHELGHAVGLADIYSATCSPLTMYGYSGYGETQKRTLESADIAGLQTLYGI